MGTANENLLDILCAAIELKEKKRELYEKAAQSCTSEVGTQTFRYLKEAEDEHLGRIRPAYEELTKGAATADACTYHDFGWEDKKAMLRKIAKEHKTISKACLDDVAAIEHGMELENAGISLFTRRLANSGDGAERDFIAFMVSEEREHYRVLADLRFYYEDPANWFMEKGRTGLDGAGAGT